jgi:hypothetical protein
MVKLLLEKGAELEPKGSHGQTPLPYAATRVVVFYSQHIVDFENFGQGSESENWPTPSQFIRL